MEDIIDYDSLTGLEKVRTSFDLDFTGSPSNEVEFDIAVTQEDSPATIGTKINFPAEFEGTML